MKNHFKRMFLIMVINLLFLFGFLSVAQSSETRVMITNVTGGQFTVSWLTDIPCDGKVYLYRDSGSVSVHHDDRGKDFKGATHYVTIKGLTERTEFLFTIESGGDVDDNGGRKYLASTGPNLIPAGSIQPAGRVFLPDGRTPARGAVVYITISGTGGTSAPLSCLVDANGYWYSELINARDEDNQRLYRVSPSNDQLNVSAKSGNGSASLRGPVLDNDGGKNLYQALILE